MSAIPMILRVLQVVVSKALTLLISTLFLGLALFLSKNILLTTAVVLAIMRPSTWILNELAHIEVHSAISLTYVLVKGLVATLVHVFVRKIVLLFLHQVIDLLSALSIETGPLLADHAIVKISVHLLSRLPERLLFHAIGHCVTLSKLELILPLDFLRLNHWFLILVCHVDESYFIALIHSAFYLNN